MSSIGETPVGGAPLGGSNPDIDTAPRSLGGGFLDNPIGSFAYLDVTRRLGESTMKERNYLSLPAVQGADYQFTADIKDENRAPIDPVAITAMTLTLYDLVSGAIIASVDHVPILGDTTRVEINSDSTMRLKLKPTDNVLLSSTLNNEQHVALVKWDYAGGQKKAAAELVFWVQRIPHLT